MNRLIRIGLLWCLAISIASAQEDESNQRNPGEPQASASSKAIVLVIDADAQKSEVVKEVIAALEKAGIATGKAAEAAPPTNSSISVTLSMRKDESYDKIKQLVEALKRAGVQLMSIRAGGVSPEGEEEQNTLILDAQSGHATDELHRIENAARYAAKKCGLSLVAVVRGREGREEGDWSPKPERTQTKLPEPVNLLPGSTQAIGLRQAQAQLRNSQLKLSKLRLQYSDQHPTVKALELEIQAMESQLQLGEELLDTLQGVRSELVKKNEAARKENGSQNTETARLETLIAELDARIKSVEGALEPAPEKVASVKVFALKYAQATDAAEVLKQVYDRGPLKIVPDARTNSVIVTGPEAQMQEIQALLLKLDEAPSAANTGANLPAQVQHIEYKETHPVHRPGETLAPPVSVIPIENEAATLVVQLEDELAQLKQSVGLESPKVKELQARIDTARKTAENSTIKDAVFRSPTDVFQWNLMASEIVQELKKDLEASSRLHGSQGSHDTAISEACDGFKELLGNWMFADETERARWSAEWYKKYQSLIEKGPEALRAERDRLIEKNNSENDEQIVELGLLIAWATVKQRYRDRNASLMRGAGAASLEDVAGVSEGSPRELQQQLAQLRKEYEAANQQAHQLAEQLNRSPDEAKQAELQKAVQRAFTARQSLLRAELIEMQTRLLKTQRSIEMRERISDQVIQRRVEDLLNPQLKWDDSALPPTKDSSPKIGTAARYNADADGDNSPERTGFSEISLRIPEKQFLPDLGTPALRVTYDDLDLFKILNMEPVPANAVEYFPDWLQALNGKTVRIRGFMYPTFEAHSLKQFTLARHNDICCFVRNPKIYDVMGVSLGEGITTDYIDGRPFDVEGTFHIEPKADENRLAHLYSISDARILEVDRRVEDLLNPQLSGSQGTSPDRVARAGSQGGANSGDGVETHGDTIVPFEHDGLSPPGVRVLDEPDENGMVLVTFQPSPHSTLERLEAGQKVFVSQTLRPTTIGFDRTPIIASGCILKEFWANRQRSASNQPVVLLIEQKQVEGLVEAEKRGALEVHGMSKAGDNETETSNPSATPMEDFLDVSSDGNGTPVDEPKQALLNKLQGYWEFQELSVENPEPRSFPNGPQMIYEIRGSRMASLPNEPQMPTWHLRFGERGIPQAIDLNTSPDHVTDPTFLGIIEIADDVVRICLNNNSGENIKRPTEFAVTKGTDILELRRRPATVTELEGDWHGVAYYDHEGKPQETLPSNRSFRGDQSSFVRPGYRHDCRIKVDPIKKTLWSYLKEEDGSFTQDYYELKGDQLILRNEPGAVGYQVFERGLVRIPSVVPPATQQQKLLWRSAIVEIVASTVGGQAPNDRVIGRGIVISSDGKMLSQLNVKENGDLSAEKITAQFDDGSVIPLKLIEKAGQGWSVLQPEQPISVNHYFESSATEVHLHDEVRVWGPDHSQAGSESLAPFANTVSALDRKYPALGIAVWQLRIGHQPVPGTPILDADGDLLGMTITGARDLLLAIPVAELKTMFPKSFGEQSESEPQPVEALPDWLSELQGTWTVTNSPIKVDENSGGQMKEIRIDRDQWSIVWTAKPGDPDRVESLRVVRPDEKNLYAIDLVELSTGKVVYPSLYGCGNSDWRAVWRLGKLQGGQGVRVESLSMEVTDE